jgi:hypothetical protein
MEASVDPLFRGPDWKPITPKRGSLLHADSQSDPATTSQGETGCRDVTPPVVSRLPVYRNRLLQNEYRAAQDTYEATQAVALNALPQALPELVFAILAPLYELFDFFPLPKRRVEEELASLQRNTFST